MMKNLFLLTVSSSKERIDEFCGKIKNVSGWLLAYHNQEIRTYRKAGISNPAIAEFYQLRIKH